MNLAEIRKKAEGAKKNVTGGVGSPLPEIEAAAESAEFELESFAGETESLAGEAVSEAEEFFSLQENPAVYADDSLPDEPALSAVIPPHKEIELEAAPAALREPPTAERAPQVLPRSAGVPKDPPAECDAPPVVTTSRSGYNPLATILCGREDAVDLEETSAFQLQSLAAGDVEEYLCFRVADEEYALSIMAVKEIIKPREVTEVPRMPNFVIGVISLRGVIIPVIDMRLRLSLPVRAATGRERIVVLRTESVFCGVLVDEVVQVARIRKADIEEPPAVLEEIDRDFVRGLGHFDNRMLILLNLETIIDISIR